jgi:hypothetical protein
MYGQNEMASVPKAAAKVLTGVSQISEVQSRWSMSGWGQTRSFGDVCGMSAFPPTTTVRADAAALR